MARDRIIYQSHAFYISTGYSTGAHSGASPADNFIKQLHRIQSVGTSVNVPRENINQYGQLGALERVILQQPTVNLEFNYLVTNAYNEKMLGFIVDNHCSAISGLLQSATDSKNFFLLITPEGADAVGYAQANNANNYVRAIGNGYINNYQVEAAVGRPPTASVTVEALNVKTDAGSSGDNTIPAVNPTNGLPITAYTYCLPLAVSGLAGQVSVVKPGDITVTITERNAEGVGYGVSIDDAKAQSFRFQMPLTREGLNKLGSTFSYSRVMRFPMEARGSLEFIMGDLATGNFADIICNDKTYDVVVALKEPNCQGTGAICYQVTLSGATLDTQNMPTNLGSNDTVSFDFSVPIQGPEDVSKGVFLSGKTS
jgi:hypothetical protein